MLEPGQTAPDFTLPRNGAGMVTLSALRPAPVVLYFYPKDDTPGCTVEAIAFTALLPEFAEAGVQVFGLSADSVAEHDAFCAKHELGVPLLSDAGGAVCQSYGVWGEKIYNGRSYMGIGRATFLIAGDGTIARVWRDVNVPGHAEEVLAAVRAL